MEEDGILVGISLADWWGDQMTPAIFRKYINAHNRRREQEMLDRDINAYQLGEYVLSAIATAFGKKDVFPDKPQLADKFERAKNPKRRLSRAETERWLAQRRKERDEQNSKD